MYRIQTSNMLNSYIYIYYIYKFSQITSAETGSTGVVDNMQKARLRRIRKSSGVQKTWERFGAIGKHMAHVATQPLRLGGSICQSDSLVMTPNILWRVPNL